MKATSTKIKSPAKKGVKEKSFPVVAIGASAGGLEAMMELLKYLPADTGMAFIYVQHLSPDHKSMLTEILSKKTSMIVQEIDEMDKIKPNHIFVIPYNKGIEVTDGHIKLIPRAENSSAVSIDVLFSSLAHAQKERVIGIILSGSASDGMVGMEDIKHQGGLTFAQDDTAKFTSMPHAAIAAGAVDFILSPKEIALKLAQLSKHPLIKTIGVRNGEEDLIDNRNPDLKNILNQLHKITGVDFNAYKMNSIKRRIIRRMLSHKITVLKEYAKLLSQKREEIEILYKDLLINVTSFFRDTDTYKYLEENLFPKLLKSKKTGDSLRMWVAACATGEEAYSMAMMLLEIQESKTNNPIVQIFATDLSEQAIRKARTGIYTIQELETVSPERIQRFFSKEDGGFRVNKTVRNMCVFAPHNILQDPPFSRLDFISCRNLFIYLNNAAQKKALNTFHYALNDDGLLMLGKSESSNQSANLFTDFNTKYKIFIRKRNSDIRILPALLPRYTHQTFPERNLSVMNKNKTKQIISVNHNGLDNAIDALLVSEFMPASVVVNHQMEIVQFRGRTELFLTHPQGKATFNIVKMARPEFAFELRNAISKVIKTNHRLRKSGIEIKINEAVKIISLEIIPLELELGEPLLLILFTEQQQAEIYSLLPPSGGRGTSLAKDRRIKKLEEELVEARLDALAFARDQEAFVEELQSANEEVISSNEELQTVNEELRTSKEETESSNEELTVTNQELQIRNDLLNQSYDYSKAIIATMPNPMLILDKSLRVKSASKVFYEKFKVNEAETEGVFLYDLGNRQWNIPYLRDRIEDILTKNAHFSDFEITHTFPLIGKRIMLLNANRIVHKNDNEELILLAFVDVTEVRKFALEKQANEKIILLKKIETEQKLKELSEEKQKQLQNIFLNAPAAIAIFEGPEHKFILANQVYEKITNRKAADLLGKSNREVFPELIGTGTFELFDHVFETGELFTTPEYAIMLDLKNDGVLRQCYFNFSMDPLKNDSGKIYGVIVMLYEITEQIEARKKVEESKKQLQNIFLNSPAALNILEGHELKYILANKAYAKLTNRKAEDLLGKSMQDVFPELISTGTLELFQKVLETGEPFSTPEYAVMVDLNNEGVIRQCYFNFSLEPLRNDLGRIYAVMATSYEITEQVEARKKNEENEKKQAFLLKLSDAIKELIDPVDIQLTACRILGEHLKVNRVLYGEVINEEQIILNNNYVNGVSPIIATLDAEQFGRNVIDAFKRNEKIIISDINNYPGYTEEEKQRFLSVDVVANAGMGLVKGGRWVATFGMHCNAPRVWTATEIWLLEETADRTWAAVVRARAEQALRKSEENYRSLFTSIDKG